MASTGVHALVGLLAARYYDAGTERLTRIAAFGFVLGQFVPDADMFLLGALYFYDVGLAMAMHRTFAHSLVSSLAIAVVGLWLFRRDRARGTVLLAVVAGMVCHVVLDLLFWFDRVAVLWPLPAVVEALPFWIDLYGGYEPPETIRQLIQAWGFLTVAGYLAVLYALSGRLGTNETYRPRLLVWGAVFAALFAVYAPLAFVLPLETYQVLLYGPNIAVFWPLSLWITVRMRETIEAVGIHGFVASSEAPRGGSEPDDDRAVRGRSHGDG